MDSRAFRWNGMGVFLASGFHSGFFPFAPGTVGSAVAIPIYLALNRGGPLVLAAGVAVSAVAGVVSGSIAEKFFAQKDPSPVVIDEIAGMLLTMLLVPFSWGALAAGFLLFRLSDIVKPFPARRFERLPGGWGILLDDLVAAAYANAVLHGLLYLRPF